MQSVITELWKFSIPIWKQQNTEYHGMDGAILLEHRRKETANEAAHMHQSTIGTVSSTDSLVLHYSSVWEILKWMQEHLDSYL
jgi:hypothetical protein